jgi:hypothetical protein
MQKYIIKFVEGNTPGPFNVYLSGSGTLNLYAANVSKAQLSLGYIVEFADGIPSSSVVISNAAYGCATEENLPFPTATPSITPSISVTPSRTPSISISATPGATITPSISITPSITLSVTKTPSITPSVTPSNTVGISITPTPSISISRTPSISATVMPVYYYNATRCHDSLSQIVYGGTSYYNTGTVVISGGTTYCYTIQNEVIPQAYDDTVGASVDSCSDAFCYVAP